MPAQEAIFILVTVKSFSVVLHYAEKALKKGLVFMYYLKNEQECFIRFKATSAQREWL
jgi:hypothetical protein